MGKIYKNSKNNNKIVDLIFGDISIFFIHFIICPPLYKHNVICKKFSLKKVLTKMKKIYINMKKIKRNVGKWKKFFCIYYEI